ncbi:hypothetical protein CEP54_015986 [Fusarium duplospermum]|uniref:2EXR domain-containing protein n=1 Tax=Fusarium duplospermum TaxID=1325734 RepID=A0A428NJB9_9HYPO|nr:hypothetical protein CEP54_015986 [Fusarium duplospermum]
MFRKLPEELQDMIWREVLELNAPTVHGIEIQRVETDQPGTRMMQAILWNSDTGVERPPIYPVRNALRQVCRGSAEAVRREERKWKAVEPYYIESERDLVAPQQADLSKDLFVLSGQFEEDVEDGDKIEGVRYVGVPWEGFWDLNLVEKLDKVVDLFPDLSVVYVVVAAASTVHPSLKPWRSSKADILQEYIDRHEETASEETAATDFRSDGLIYREISPESLVGMGDLHEPMTFVDEFFTGFDHRHQQGEGEAEAEEEAGIEGGEELETEAEEEEELKGEEVEVLQAPVVRVMTWERAHRKSSGSVIPSRAGLQL